MNKFLVFFTVLLLMVGGFAMLNNLPKAELDKEGLLEHDKKKKWILSMLADPETGKIPEGATYQELQFLKENNELFGTSEARKFRSTWKFRGPVNVGGRTRGMAVDVNDDNHIIAGSVSGGIWQSKDGGESWKKVSLPNDHPGVVSICQDTKPGNRHIWYALSGELYGTSASGSGSGSFYLGDGAFRSLDNGETWSPITSTAVGVPTTFSTSYQGGWRIQSSPVDSVDHCVYMACYGGIYRSRDTGNTWQAVLGGNNTSYFSDLAISKSGIVYAALSADGTTKGFFRSSNGVNFTNITPSFLKNYNRTVLDINPNNENEVYFLSELEKDSSGGVVTTNYEGTPEYVSLLKYTYLSGDGSGSDGLWTNLSGNLPVTDPDEFDKFNTQGGYDLFVRAHKGSNAVIIGGTNIYISENGFTKPEGVKQIGGYGIATQLATFTTYPNHHPDQHDLIFSSPNNPNKAFSASDGGVRVTQNIMDDEVVWKDISIGYNTSQFYTVTIDENTAYDQWLLGGLQDNGNYLTKTNNVYHPWNMTINGDGAYNYIAPDKSFCVISTQLGNMRKVILDANGHVLKRKRIDPNGYDKSSYNFINPIAVDPNDDNYLYTPIGKRIGVMNNLRKLNVIHDNSKLNYGWTVTADTIKTLPNTSVKYAEITTVAVSKNPAHVVYVGTNNREVFKLENPLSANPTFKKLSIQRLPPNGYVSQIVIDPDDAEKLFVVYSNYNITSLFYSSNGGTSWQYAGGNLEGVDNSSGSNPSLRCMAILKNPDGHKTYFCGTSVGLFSTDTLKIDTVGNLNQTVWKQESPDLIGANVVTDIKTRNSDGYVVVATHGNGVFESYYTGNKAPVANYIPNSIDVYPNPAMDYVTFTFQSVKDEMANAYIVDYSGRKVSTIFKEKLNADILSYKTDIRHLQSGHYFVVFYSESSKKPSIHHFVKIK